MVQIDRLILVGAEIELLVNSKYCTDPWQHESFASDWKYSLHRLFCHLHGTTWGKNKYDFLGYWRMFLDFHTCWGWNSHIHLYLWNRKGKELSLVWNILMDSVNINSSTLATRLQVWVPLVALWAVAKIAPTRFPLIAGAVPLACVIGLVVYIYLTSLLAKCPIKHHRQLLYDLQIS